MFSLRGTIMKALGLTDNESDTDVEAWTRIQEAMDVERANGVSALATAEQNFTATATSLTEKFEAQATQLSAQATQIAELVKTIDDVKATSASTLADLKTQFAKDIATVKAGSASETSEGEFSETEETDTPAKKVAAWKKPIVNISQKV